MSRIAIMQGRLLPPQEGRFQCFPAELWQEEFAAASAAGLDAIEWIYDLQGAEANPIGTDDGIIEMREISWRHKIAVVSVCADYFMDRPLITESPAELGELTTHLLWLISRCHSAGITRLTLPFVDCSAIETSGQIERVIAILQLVLPRAADAGVEIHLETSLAPGEFACLLARLPHPILKVTYDSGNSASLGYDVRQELAAYGRRVGSVHIKDRIRGGATVPLGAGAADIPALIAGLAEIKYSGDYVLQVARGAPGDEVAWAQQNRGYLSRQLEQAKLAAARRAQ